jgi:transcriptional regulator with XRE-family HTH domain
LIPKGSRKNLRHKMARVNINIKVGRRIRFFRSQLGLSQEELAFKADLHRAYIGQIERGEKNLGLVNLERIANALNVKINVLLES